MKAQFAVKNLFLFAVLALGTPALWAQADYPTRPIRLVTPLPVGSPFDVVARKYAEELASRLKTSVVIDNKPGANGVIAAIEVIRASADGYTLLITVSDPLVGTPATTKVNYDPERDFLPISKIAINAPVLVANSKCHDQLKELVAGAKVDSGSVCASYGSFGEGSFPKLVFEAINRQADAAFREVPYRGAAPALQDALGGQIGLAFTSASQTAQLAAEGRVKPVAIMGPIRSPLLAHVPTFAEAGYDNFATQRAPWFGLVGQAGLPQDIVNKLATATHAVVTDPAFSKWLRSRDCEPIGGTSAQFEKELKAEQAAVIGFIRNELRIAPK